MNVVLFHSDSTTHTALSLFCHKLTTKDTKYTSSITLLARKIEVVVFTVDRQSKLYDSNKTANRNSNKTGEFTTDSESDKITTCKLQI